MSRKKKNHKNKSNQSANSHNITNPDIAFMGLFFSVEIQDEEHYHEFVEYAKSQVGLVREVLIHSKAIPKYFDVLVSDDVHDLKPLIAPLTMEVHPEYGMRITREAYDEDRDDQIQISYADFISRKLEQSDFAQRLASLKSKQTLPHVLTHKNGPVLSKGHFYLDFDSENQTQLCDFDYKFPQECVFALDFQILGNKNPITKFKEQCENIEIEDFINQVLDEPTLSILGFDLFSEAHVFKLTLEQANFKIKLDNAIERGENTVLTLDSMPVFIAFNDNKELNIRVPFVTFDMFAQDVLLPEDHDLVEPLYINHELKRLSLSNVLNELGLDYDYVVGQRIDFFYEKEMQHSVITKVMQREIIEGNVYYENSDHHAQGTEEQATLISAGIVLIDIVPVVVMTMQNDEGIVKQVNAYFMDIENLDDPFDQVSDYFFQLGRNTLKRVMLDEPLEMQYCEHHMKINGIVI